MGGVQESAPDCILQSGCNPKENTGFAPFCGGVCQITTWNSWFHSDCTLIAVFLYSDCTFEGSWRHSWHRIGTHEWSAAREERAGA